nr:winged helix-turn-helix domain-containing protein [uncultured Duganella sp.]
MLPFLKFLGDSQEHSLQGAEEALAAYFESTPQERAELLPSGQQGVFKNRIGWARTYLRKAGLIESPNAPSLKLLIED